jgi:hypothetical protein
MSRRKRWANAVSRLLRTSLLFILFAALVPAPSQGRLDPPILVVVDGDADENWLTDHPPNESSLGNDDQRTVLPESASRETAIPRKSKGEGEGLNWLVRVWILILGG